MPLFQYQQLVEPSIVSVDVPSVASWLPTSINALVGDDDTGIQLASKRRSGGHKGGGGGGNGGGGGGPIEPPIPPVPTYAQGIFPDQVPHTVAPRTDLGYVPLPTIVATVEAWWPSFPDRLPHAIAPWGDSAPVIQSSEIVNYYWPSFPDQLPRLAQVLLANPMPVGIAGVPGAEFWYPSFPDRLVPFPPAPWGQGGVGPFEPVVPSISRAIPQGPTFAVWEQTSGRYLGQLVKGDLVTPLPGTLLTSLTLTLYMIDANDVDIIINGRNKQNVLNQNGVTVSPSGLLTWTWTAADTALASSAPFERHLALFEWTWPNGAGKREVILVVRNLRRVS